MFKRKLELEVVDDLTTDRTSVNVLPIVVDGGIMYTNHWLLIQVSPVIGAHVAEAKDLSDIRPFETTIKCKEVWKFVVKLARHADLSSIRFNRVKLDWVALFTLLSLLNFNRGIREELFRLIIHFPLFCKVNWSTLPYEYIKIITNQLFYTIQRKGPIGNINFIMHGLSKKENLLKMINDLGLQRDLFNQMVEMSGPPASFTLV